MLNTSGSPYGKSDLPSAPSGIEALVCSDLTTRQLHGMSKYGTTVMSSPATLLQWHTHHYQELLDAAVYVRKIIHQLDPNYDPSKTVPTPTAPRDDDA